MKKHIAIFLLILGSAIVANAQFVLNKADEQMSLFNFEKAIALYTEAYQKKETKYAVSKLAECNRLIRDYNQAESWYAILVAMDDVDPEAVKWYAEMLRINSKYSEAKAQYARYGTVAKNLNSQQLAQLATWQLSCDSAVKWMNKPKKVQLTNEKELNSEQSDWGAVMQGDSFIFTSDRINSLPKKPTGKTFLKLDGGVMPDKQVYGWTGSSYLKLYQKTADGVQLLELPVETDYHVGSPSFSADGNEVFYTITRTPKKIQTDKNGIATLNVEIFSSVKENGVWSKPKPFKYNNLQKWSVGDPFLVKDGSTLFFVSDMPNGKGGTDIYFCKRTKDGAWGDAVNVESLNTLGSERTPVLNGTTIYFATDGLITMGGLDLFKARFVDERAANIENLGAPINSPRDDFSISFSADGKKVFFASDREGGMGKDDIYSYIEQQNMLLKLTGVAYNKETKLPLKNAVVTLKMANNTRLIKNTDSAGKFDFDIPYNQDFVLVGSKTNFTNAKELVTSKNLAIEVDIVKKDLYLTPIVIDKPIKIENIYYDFDRDEIRADAAIELDKLVVLLTENPTIWIEIGSHTDSRGKDQYNLSLSQKRASAVVKYIVQRGIDQSRITARGYGETKPINKCTNGVDCTEDEFQLNRRTEFKIVKQ